MTPGSLCACPYAGNRDPGFFIDIKVLNSLEYTVMRIDYLPITSVKPYQNNPRNNKDAIDKVADSIKAFGWQQPIVVDGNNIIIVGHTRYQAAQKLGLSTVPVLVASDLSPEQVKAYRIADNKVGEIAEWDNDLLKIEFNDLQDMHFDLSLTGFDKTEIDQFLIDPESIENDTDPQIERAAELRKHFAVEPGQIWALGEHRILCGDSTDSKSVSKLFRDDHPNMMVTDPPYGVEYDASWRSSLHDGKGNPATGKVLNDNMPDWREAYLLFPGAIAYIWHTSLYAGVVYESISTCGFDIRNLIIWKKSNFAISRGHYHHQFEPCLYAVRKGKTASWIGDRKQSTVWDIDKQQKSETGHSTQKPLECMARPIRNHDSEWIYDPFAGSGTTIIACENLHRKCLAIELNPDYVAVILQRYLDHTGNNPVRLE